MTLYPNGRYLTTEQHFCSGFSEEKWRQKETHFRCIVEGMTGGHLNCVRHMIIWRQIWW